MCSARKGGSGKTYETAVHPCGTKVSRILEWPVLLCCCCVPCQGLDHAPVVVSEGANTMDMARLLLPVTVRGGGQDGGGTRGEGRGTG